MRRITLEQLQRQFATPCPSLEAVRAEYFPHLNERQLLRKIRSGSINLRITQHDRSQRAPRVVYLHDLAAYLDAQQTSNTNAA